MNIGSLLICFALDTLWVWVVGLAILLLLRMIKRKLLFTENWLALRGHTRAEVLSSRLLLRFSSLLLPVIPVGLAIGQWIAPAWSMVDDRITATRGNNCCTCYAVVDAVGNTT